MEENRFPDKRFFWGIAFTVLPTWSTRYHKKVLDNRAKEEKVNPNDSREIKISDKWKDELMKYDFKSAKGK